MTGLPYTEFGIFNIYIVNLLIFCKTQDLECLLKLVEWKKKLLYNSLIFYQHLSSKGEREGEWKHKFKFTFLLIWQSIKKVNHWKFQIVQNIRSTGLLEFFYFSVWKSKVFTFYILRKLPFIRQTSK